MISDEDREKVRQATDILALVSETVELRQRGASDFWGCCPFHHEKSPSFHVNTQTGLWKCFGCGAGGDVFDYVMKRESLDFPDAIRYLAERDGIELSEERGPNHRGPRRNRLLECLGEAESFYSTMLLRGRGAGPDAGRRYLGGRGFGSAVCRSWHLGFAPGRGTLVAHLRSKGFSTQEMLACDLAVMRDGRPSDRFYDRVMFPIHDEQGRTIAFGGRVLTDAKPKYLNTKETSVFHKGKHLFAFDRAKESIAARGTAIVSEGYTDVISLHEAGYTNAVAALGTSFSLDHVRTLSRFAKRIVCMFDGDAAGQRAAERAIQFIDKTEADLRCVVLPDDQDPAEFLSTHQPEELGPIIEAARPLMDFVFEKRLEGYDLASPGRRVAALQEMAKLLAPLKTSFVLDGYATQLADALGMDVAETKRVIRETPAPRFQGEEDVRPAPSRAARAGSRGQRGGAGARGGQAPYA
ncbi:MAG: DNA primase, partial [Atopobiaceae bacterium]|nr:DNA primase [Atopobiaceae bacterium]